MKRASRADGAAACLLSVTPALADECDSACWVATWCASPILRPPPLNRIEHDRCQVLHVNVSAHPTAAWVTQQLREVFPFARAPRYLLMDRDSIFSAGSAAG